MKTKKKLLYVISKIGMGGAQNIVINLVNGLVQSGYEVDLVIFFRTAQDNENIARLDSRVRVIRDFELPGRLSSDHAHPALRFLYLLLLPFLVFTRVLQDKKFSTYDFVHSHLLLASQFSYYFDLSLKLLRKPRPRFVETFHADFTSITKLEASLFLFFWKHLDILVLELRRKDFNDIRSRLGNVDVRYIPFGIPLPGPTKAGDQPLLQTYSVDSRTCIVSISRLNNQEKKVDRLIDVIYELKKIRGDTFSFLLCGDGPDMNVIRQQVKDLGLEKNVIFTGYIKDVYAQLSVARAFLIMGIEDLVGIAGLQAASLGVPVVSYQGDPIWTSHPEDAFFNSASTEELAVHLNGLIEDEALFRRESDRCQRVVRDVFSFDATLKHYCVIYDGKADR